jgi:hypothetical protein
MKLPVTAAISRLTIASKACQRGESSGSTSCIPRMDLSKLAMKPESFLINEK